MLYTVHNAVFVTKVTKNIFISGYLYEFLY